MQGWLTLDLVVVEVQVLQVRADHGDGVDLVVGQLQVQQGGNIEHAFGKPFVTQLIAVQSHKRQMIHVFEVVPEEQMKRKQDEFKSRGGYKSPPMLQLIEESQ